MAIKGYNMSNTGSRDKQLSVLETIRQKRQDGDEKNHKKAVVGAFNNLAGEVRSLIDSLEKTGARTLDKDFVDSVKELSSVASKLEDIKITSDEDIKRGLYLLAEAFSQLEVRPVVNVQAPKVEVKERDIDFKPLIDKISSDKPDEFKAQDLDEPDLDKQYVGFVNSAGNWYIVENNLTTATLRYKFGKKGYTRGWNNRAKHTYKLYNEAVDALSA